MAFTGTAAIKKVADNLYRITGLSLAAAASGTIGLAENSSAAVQLEGTGWNRYQTTGAHGGQVELDESVQLSYEVAEAALAVVEPLSIVKSGDGPEDFLITLTNPDAAASGALEIYVRFH